MLFFRQLQHLLPDATAWRVTTNKTLRRFLQGLAQAPADARDFIDAIYQDLSPDTTRELATWERHFGLTAATTEATRRLQLAGAWSAQGGQSPRYLQDVVQAAGFNVWLHEWWQPGTTPRVARNPRDYTDDPRIGTVQCAEMDLAFCCTSPDAPLPDPMPAGIEVADLYPQCNRWLTNEVGYLVNLNLTREAPPPVPDDTGVAVADQRWPYFLYWCGQVFGMKAQVPAARREEFERLLLKLCPTQQWLVTYVDYV